MSQEKPPIISAIEVANYVVCPQAWKLKRKQNEDKETLPTPAKYGTQQTKSVRKEWVKHQEVSYRLHTYTRTLLLLLGVLVVVLIALDSRRQILSEIRTLNPYIEETTSVENQTIASNADANKIPHEIYTLLLLLGVLILIIDFFLRKRGEIQSKGGLEKSSQIISIKGSNQSAQKDLSSEISFLTATPDALIKEKGHTIPVLIKPSTTKVRDRHVVELITSLKLLEEKDETPAPYGLLLMGQAKKRIELKYTEEKSNWFDSLIKEMRSILTDDIPAQATPTYHKCKHCDVRNICEYSAFKTE